MDNALANIYSKNASPQWPSLIANSRWGCHRAAFTFLQFPFPINQIPIEFLCVSQNSAFGSVNRRSVLVNA
jgi:hypothetical protein